MELPRSNRRSVVRRLSEGVSVYLLALVIVGALRLLAVAFIVRAISPSVYGTYATLLVVIALVQGGGDLGLGTAALRLAPERADPESRRALFATLLTARAAVGVLLTAVLVAAHRPLARWVTGSAENGEALLWLALSAPPALVFDGLADELRGRGAMRTLSLLNVFLAVAVQGLSVLLVVRLGWGLMGLVVARLAAEMLACAVALISCWPFIRGRPRLAELGPLLSFGWPFGSFYLLVALRTLDRPLIRTFGSLEHVAAYELGARLVGPVGTTNLALSAVFEPFAYGHAKSDSTPHYVGVFLRAYVAVFATVAMALSVLGPEAVTLFAPAPYHGAIRALPPLAFATACEGLRRIAGIGADFAKRTRVWAAVGIGSLLIGLPAAVALVPRLGVAGAGFAWVAANAVTTLVVDRIAREASGIALPTVRALAILLAGAVIGTAAAWQPWPLTARLALLVGFGLVASRSLGVRWLEVKRAFSN